MRTVLDGPHVEIVYDDGKYTHWVCREVPMGSITCT
jgi:hypothetical protein